MPKTASLVRWWRRRYDAGFNPELLTVVLRALDWRAILAEHLDSNACDAFFVRFQVVVADGNLEGLSLRRCRLRGDDVNFVAFLGRAQQINAKARNILVVFRGKIPLDFDWSLAIIREDTLFEFCLLYTSRCV